MKRILLRILNSFGLYTGSQVWQYTSTARRDAAIEMIQMYTKYGMKGFEEINKDD